MPVKNKTLEYPNGINSRENIISYENDMAYPDWNEHIFTADRIEIFQNTDMIETGTFQGVSSRYFANFFRRVVTFDPWDGRQIDEPGLARDLPLIFVKNKTPNMVHFRIGSGTPYAKQTLSILNDFHQMQYTFAYIDGLHTTDQVILDFQMIDEVLSNGGYILIDDVDYPPVNYGVNDSIVVSRRYRELVDHAWVGSMNKPARFFQKLAHR